MTHAVCRLAPGVALTMEVRFPSSSKYEGAANLGQALQLAVCFSIIEIKEPVLLSTAVARQATQRVMHVSGTGIFLWLEAGG